MTLPERETCKQNRSIIKTTTDYQIKSYYEYSDPAYYVLSFHAAKNEVIMVLSQSSRVGFYVYKSAVGLREARL